MSEEFTGGADVPKRKRGIGETLKVTAAAALGLGGIMATEPAEGQQYPKGYDKLIEAQKEILSGRAEKAENEAYFKEFDRIDQLVRKPENPMPGIMDYRTGLKQELSPLGKNWSPEELQRFEGRVRAWAAARNKALSKSR